METAFVCVVYFITVRYLNNTRYTVLLSVDVHSYSRVCVCVFHYIELSRLEITSHFDINVAVLDVAEAINNHKRCRTCAHCTHTARSDNFKSTVLSWTESAPSTQIQAMSLAVRAFSVSA